MERYRDEYSWSECETELLRRSTLLIRGSRAGEREEYFRDRWHTDAPTTKILELELSETWEAHSWLYAAGKQRPAVPTISTDNLVGTLHASLRRLDLASVVMDITGLQHQAIMCATQEIMLAAAGELFALYAEPTEYVRHPDTGEFDLTRRHQPRRAVPGFARQRRPGNAIVVALLGFEGIRLTHLLEELQDVLDVAPVLGVPSFRPGWNLRSLAGAVVPLNSRDMEIHACPAHSVTEAYNILDAIAHSSPAHNIILAPIGTRPHTLAAAIYASHHSRVLIEYDNPLESLNRSIGIGSLHAYHLSAFL
jgi:hypothetical protein